MIIDCELDSSFALLELPDKDNWAVILWENILIRKNRLKYLELKRHVVFNLLLNGSGGKKKL